MKAISLCRELGLHVLFIDGREGYEFSKLLKLRPYRITPLLLKFYKEDLLNYEESCDSILKLSEEGYFLSARVYEELIRVARELKK